MEISNAVRTLIGLVLTQSSNTEAPDGILATGMEILTTPKLLELLTPALLNGDTTADPYEVAVADDDDDEVSEDRASESSTALSTALAVAVAVALAGPGDLDFELGMELMAASPFKISVVWTRKKPSTTGNNLERRDMRVDWSACIFCFPFVLI